LFFYPHKPTSTDMDPDGHTISGRYAPVTLTDNILNVLSKLELHVAIDFFSLFDPLPRNHSPPLLVLSLSISSFYLVVSVQCYCSYKWNLPAKAIVGIRLLLRGRGANLRRPKDNAVHFLFGAFPSFHFKLSI